MLPQTSLANGAVQNVYTFYDAQGRIGQPTPFAFGQTVQLDDSTTVTFPTAAPADPGWQSTDYGPVPVLTTDQLGALRQAQQDLQIAANDPDINRQLALGAGVSIGLGVGGALVWTWLGSSAVAGATSATPLILTEAEPASEIQPGALSGAVEELDPVERAMANALVAAGHDVEVVPRTDTPTPDFLVDGVQTELKTSSGTGPRLQTRSQPERDEGCEGDGGEEVGCKLVVAGGHASEVLDPAEGVLDAVALSVAGLVVDDLALAANAAGDDRHGPCLAQGASERVGVVSLVSEHVAGPAGAGEQRGRYGDVGDVAGRQDQSEGASDGVGEGVDLGRLAAARGADRLRFRPPFPPNAERWALM